MAFVLRYQMRAICLKPGVCSGFIQAFLDLKHDKIMAFLSIIVIYNICLAKARFGILGYFIYYKLVF